MNDVFPLDDHMFSALVQKLAYGVYTLHVAVFTIDTPPWDGFVPGFAITNNGPNAWRYGLPFCLINILT